MGQRESLWDISFSVRSFSRGLKDEEKQLKQEADSLENDLNKMIKDRNFQESQRKRGSVTIAKKKMDALEKRKLSQRMDGVAQRVEHALKMKRVTKIMNKITGELNEAIAKNNLEDIREKVKRFEEMYEECKVVVDEKKGLESNTCDDDLENEAKSLLRRVVQEHNIELEVEEIEKLLEFEKKS